MEKVKVLKELPKTKKKYLKKSEKKALPSQDDKFKDIYLNFYDDIKVPSKRYHW